jgi:hypothetical protein
MWLLTRSGAVASIFVPPGAVPNGQLRSDADGMVHIPFSIRHSHWWTKSVILHADRHPVLPPSSSVPPLIRKVSIRAARMAIGKGGVGSLVHGASSTTKGGSSAAPVSSPASTKERSSTAQGTTPAPRGIWAARRESASGQGIGNDAGSARGGGGVGVGGGKQTPSVPPPATKKGIKSSAPTKGAAAVGSVTVVHKASKPAVTTFPCVELFSGIGSASHYLRTVPTICFSSGGDI